MSRIIRPLKAAVAPLRRNPSFIQDHVIRYGTLEPKDFGGSIIDSRNLKEMAEEIRLNPGVVKKLIFGNSRLGFEEAKILADLIATDTTLEQVDLKQNNLGDKGAEALAEAFKENKSVRVLNLCNNNIEHNGCRSLARMLVVNKGLEIVDFGGDKNAIPGNDFPELIEAIEKNTKMESLTIGFEYSGFVSLRTKIQTALEVNAGLHLVKFPRNNLDDQRPDDSNYVNFFEIYNNNSRQVSDAVKDYSDIVLTRIIRKLNADHPQLDLSYLLPQLKKMAFEKTKKILFNGLTNAEILDFSKHWHSPFHQTTSQKLRDYGGAEWAPLFAEKEIEIPALVTGEDGWKLVARTNPMELKQEGKNLKHCVGGYSSRCIQGDSHIVSMVNGKGDPVSTIEFALDKEGSLTKKQNYGKDNSSPPPQAVKASEWILSEVEKGKKKINHEGIAAAQVKIAERKESPYFDFVGFDPLDDRKLSELIRVYKKQMLPSGKFEIPTLTRNFLTEFLGEIKIKNLDTISIFYLQNISEITLESVIEKPVVTIDDKIKAGLQGSTNKVCGKDVVTISIADNEVFFSTKNSDALDKLKKIFAEKFVEKEDGLVIKGDLNPQSVREVMTHKALEVRNEKKLESQKRRGVLSSQDDINLRPGSVVREPNFVNNNSRPNQI